MSEITTTQPINPAILPMVPETLLIASEPALWEGMKRIVQMYGKNLPQGVDQGTAILLMLAAKEYGLNPLEAISNLFFIGGRIVPSANTIVRLATGNGLSIKPLVESDTVWEAEFSRAGRESIVQRYTIEEAQKAGITSNGTWKKFPRMMLRARCVSAAIRLYAGDLVRGIEYSAEELTNGSGHFDANGNFTPDPNVIGQQPAKDFKPFEGRTSDKVADEAPATSPEDDKPEPPKPTKKKKAEPQAEVPQDTVIESPEHNGDVAVAEPAQEEVDQYPGVEGKAITLARGGNNRVDFDATIKNIFAMLVKVEGGQDAAKKKAAEFMAQVGVKAAAQMKGQVSFVTFFMLADAYCAQKLVGTSPAPVAEVPAFDPKRGARTNSASSEVRDAPADEVVNLDAAIMDLFTELANMGLDEQATAVMEDTGYADQSEGAPASVKLQTIESLKTIKLEGIKQAS